MPEAGAPGVARRHIGSFSERRIEIAQIGLDAGARATETAPAAPRFLFVTDGTGIVGGTPVRGHSLVELAAGESTEIAAAEALVLLTISMPVFTAEEIAFFAERNRRKTSAAA
jgi:hypothetical protein